MKDTSRKSSLQLFVLVLPKYVLSQRTPWISLSLLLASYTIQGYLLKEHQPLLICPIIVFSYALLQWISFNSSVQQARNTVMQWVISDAIHLISILVLAFLSSFVLSSLEILKDLLLVLAAEILARLDLQQRGLNQVQKATILTLCLTLGLAIGWMANELIA